MQWMFPASSAPEEYVADVTDLRGFPRATVTSYDEALQRVTTYLDQRVEAVLARDLRRPAIMLSGGIDSVLLAAVVAAHRPDALAVTVQFDYPETQWDEVDVARAVAKHLNLEHVVMTADTEYLNRTSRQVMTTLETADPWEVLAGVVLTMGTNVCDTRGATGAIFTGAGADAVFLGGEAYCRPGAWYAYVEEKVTAHFVRDRAIPDFYERLLTQPERHIQSWQTCQGVEVAFRLRPTDVRGKDMATDKKILRDAAVQLGIPRQLTMRKKDPMQASSGGIGALEWAAREYLAAHPVHTTYADPRTEPAEHVIARLWLENLS